MNIKKIFNESASDLLAKKKSDYLADLEKEAKKVIESKTETRAALVKAQEDAALKIARIGQAKNIDEFGSAVASARPEDLAYTLLESEAQIKKIDSEVSDLKAALAELFG